MAEMNQRTAYPLPLYDVHIITSVKSVDTSVSEEHAAFTFMVKCIWWELVGIYNRQVRRKVITKIHGRGEKIEPSLR